MLPVIVDRIQSDACGGNRFALTIPGRSEPELEGGLRQAELIAVNLVGSGFNVDGNEFAFVARLHDGAKLMLINRIPATGKLFFAISGWVFIVRLDSIC